MILLSVNAVAKQYGPEPVLSGVTFDLRPGQRIALVGPNGAGKTTLLRILAGQEEADSGSVRLHPSARQDYLQQQPQFAAGRTVWQEARAALGHLTSLAETAERVARQMADADSQAEQRRLGEQLDRLQHELDRHDGYNLDYRIERVLHGLGFAGETFHRPVEQLSGGQQNRLLLAGLLLSEPDVMLLDEPSNHLDIEATEWLETHLAQTRAALIVVSHDRYFLDKVTNRTLELFRGTVDDYSGNFSAYWRQKAERLQVERRTYRKQQAEMAKMADFIRRNAYGQKHAQAEDRRKKLARIEPVAPPREIAAPVMGLPPASRTGDVVLRVEHLSKGYDEPLFDDLTFQVARGERWGILGPNGCGKTTLLRTILGEVEPDAGRVIFGTGVVVGYFDQLLSCLDDEAEVVDAIRPPHKEMIQPRRRDLLARFGLIGDLVFQKVRSLSGGERNRAALAQLAGRDANLLVLDEPTNHLDLWARDSLEETLKRFRGTVLLVSHDRYFLNRVVDHLLVVEPGGFRVIEGSYDLYLHLVREGLAGVEAPGSVETSDRTAKTAGADRKGRPPQKPRGRVRRFPYRKTADLEGEILERETQIQDLHRQLASPKVLRDGRRVKTLKAELDRQRQALATLYEHWEEAAELNWE